MQFTSLEFIFFFLAVLFLNTFLKSRIRTVFLIIASIYFTAVISGVAAVFFIVLLLLFSLFNAAYIKYRESKNIRPLYLFFIFSIILILVLFKYYGYIAGLVSIFTGINTQFAFSKLVPLGISYFTFQLLAYFIDVHNKRIEPEKNPLKFILFIVYFPKIISGPIERGSNFLPQTDDRPLDYNFFINGLKMFIWGFFCKSVIADRLAVAVDKVFYTPADFSPFQVFIAVLFFTFQLYSDFAGYTYMALGASQMLGIKLTNNFRTPFFSKSISEFWTRWHITLSSWLRDYIFLPLSLTLTRQKSVFRKIFGNEKVVYVTASIVTMSICGIWHGPKLTFFLWGLLHGLFLSASFITKKFRKNIIKKTGINKNGLLLEISRIVFVFSLIVFSFLIFKADSINNVSDIITRIFQPWSSLSLGSLFFIKQEITIAIMSIIFLCVIDFILYRKNSDNGRFEIHDVISMPLMIILIALIIIFGKFGAGDFIYFKF